ncbi:hypothetical protein HYS28_03370 [Candidatus Uhrbacteria bacterium]|nr:hypothetical protein [Candidatus Uhrbacteria bacterium]
MQISGHYPAFSKKTLLVLTNNELAKCYTLVDREIDEAGVITTPDNAPAATPASPADLDAAKQHRRQELYTALSDDLLSRIDRDGVQDVILCAPEANKNDLTAAMDARVMKRVKTVVPKNLASMELGQVVRILFES